MKEILFCEEQIRLADASPEPDTSGILDGLLADDVLMVGPQGQLFDKAFVLKAHRPPMKTAFESVLVSGLEVRDLGGSTAFTSCACEYRVGGKAFSLRFTRVWSKRSGAWKLIAGSVTQIV